MPLFCLSASVSSQVNVPTVKVHCDELLVEIYNESDLRADECLGAGRVFLASTLAYNTGKDVTVTVPLRTKTNVKTGQIVLVICSDESKDLPTHNADPLELDQLELVPDPSSALETSIELKSSASLKAAQSLSQQLLPKHPSIFQNSGCNANSLLHNDDNDDDGREKVNKIDALSGVYPSLLEQQSSFSKLISDLRGDGASHVKMLIGDVDFKRVLNYGHRPTGSSLKVRFERIDL